MSKNAVTPRMLKADVLRSTRKTGELRAALKVKQRRHLADTGRESSAAMFNAVFDQAQPFAGLLDPDGVVRQANRTACAFIGCDPSAVVGRFFWETPWWRHSVAEQEKLRSGVARAAHGECVSFETSNCASDGSVHPIGFSIRPAREDGGRVSTLIAEGRDISRRKQMEEALERARALLEAVLEQSPVPMVIVSVPDLIVRYYNQPTREILGTIGTPGSMGRPLADVFRDGKWHEIHPDGTPYAAADLPLTRALHGEATRNVEIGVVRRDGSCVWVMANGSPIYDHAGKLVAGVIDFSDITERRKTLEQIRQMANEQRTILDTITTGISLLKKRRLQWANPAFAAMFGYEIGELQRVDAAQFYADKADYKRVGQEGFTQIAQGRGYSIEALMKRKNGTVFWCHLSGRAVDPKRLEEGLIWATQDITERREAEEALREGEQRLKRLLKNSNDIIAITNGNGVLISVSGASKTMLGFEPEGLVGQKTFDYVHPDDLALARKTFADALANPGITQRGEFRLRHRNGDWIEVEALGTSWAHDSGIAENVMNIRNISERKSAERERAKLQGQLQQAMKMEAVGRLAGGIAHDFNNLLTVIGGNVELARRDLDPSDPLAHYLVEVSKAAASAASLTGQLLAFSRRRIIVPRVLNPNDLIENLRKMLGRIVGEDIALQTNLAEELGAVKVDPGQFDQVVVNLAVNARDAMPEGGRLTIETANCDLDEAYCRQHADVSPGRYVMIAVSDTGQGMDAEVRRRLFEPFFTTKPVGRGTGLGLAMIFGAVKQSGGTIDVHSEVGQGTTFKIYLPRIEAPAEKLAVVPLSLDLPGGSETVLLVEDEASVRGLISSVLKRLGYKVLVAANGGEAFMLTEKYTGGIDLMMTDVVMPGMNGRELAERLRQFKPEMEVLFTSGYTESVIVHNAVVDERLNFIGKPYSMQGIARKIREVIEARKGRDRR